ncbi:hypothetical protein WJX72_000156 [[Myrmecia] bisecta]|uniref:Uncharacterized protein n=1 Tax=[Myrmecia] bisecta TaxID=41462 RepID=A0AAW1R459_9CHLO
MPPTVVNMSLWSEQTLASRTQHLGHYKAWAPGGVMLVTDENGESGEADLDKPVLLFCTKVGILGIGRRLHASFALNGQVDWYGGAHIAHGQWLH